MKILYIASAGSIHSLKWIKYFYKNAKILWVTTETPIEDMPEHIDCQYIDMQNISIIKRLKEIKKMVIEFDPDITQIHYLGMNAVIGLYLSKGKLILTAWGSDIIINKNNIIKKYIVKKIIKKANKITCDANHMKQKLINLGADPNKIIRINFGIETNLFKNAKKTLKDFEKKQIISLRNLEKIYDVETLVKATKIITQYDKDIKVVIAGDGKEREELENLTKFLGLENNIVFHGKYKMNELPFLLEKSTIYVSTSLSDAGISSSTAEAMLSGLPVVISNSGENREWIQDNVNGILFECQDVEELATKIIFLLDNKLKMKDMGIKGRETIRELNDYNKEMKKVYDCYKEIINDRL